VVDDVAGNRAVLTDLLLPLDFDMREADNGRSAIEMAAETTPDRILMDRVMPVTGGLEAIRKLREMPALSSTCIIAVSASASALDQRACLAAGASAFLAKPIKVEALLAQIGQLFGLTWRSAAGAAAAAVHPDVSEPIVSPPPHELVLLQTMAKKGNMRAIRSHTLHLETLGERYHPLARTLRRLADGFQSRAIFDLVSELQARAER